METFTGFEYIKLDIANQFGLDKENFEPRLAWVDSNLDRLEELLDDADEPVLYLKAVMALRDAQAGIASGHLVGFDACASGLQIQSCLIGCEVTAKNTGLIDPNNRADIYAITTEEMNNLLKHEGIQLAPLRKEVKQAQMTHFYGSKAKPKEIFGEDTIELSKFYEAQKIVAPGACEVMDDLMASWQSWAPEHSWTLPDGFNTIVKVMQEVDIKVEVDELDHSTFTHRFMENRGSEHGLSIAANIVHSIDGMVVREMGRRCNYDVNQLTKAIEKIRVFLDGRAIPGKPTNTDNFISLVHVENIDQAIVELSINDLVRLRDTILAVVEYRNFPIVCVHDEFKCHPNHVNRLRYWYKEILAEIAESKILEQILSDVHGTPVTYVKWGNIADKIRQSNYALS
ncbi:MAG: DNA-directed RNA polymerase [Neptuniibacter sp.]